MGQLTSHESDRTPAGITCIRCGYELTGLDVAGSCPECGIDIARSVDGDRLADADPTWLGRLVLGLRLLAWGPMLFVIGVITAILGFVAAAGLEVFDTSLDWLASIMALLMPVAGGAMMIGPLMAAIGGLLVTMGEPRDADRGTRLEEPRQIARWGLVAAVLCIAADALLSAHLVGIWGGATSDALTLVAILGGGLGFAGLHRRLAELARRLPSPTIVTTCTEAADWYRKVTIGVVVILALNLLGTVLEGFTAAERVAIVINVVTTFGNCAIVIIALLAFFRILKLMDLAAALRSGIRLTLDAEAPETERA